MALDKVDANQSYCNNSFVYVTFAVGFLSSFRLGFRYGVNGRRDSSRKWIDRSKRTQREG